MSTHSERYLSVDSMRGLMVATMLIVNNPGNWQHVYASLSHTAWNGCSLADLVFPGFLFLVGVSISLHKSSALQNGLSFHALRGAILKRSAGLIMVGLLLNTIMTWAFHAPHLFWMGTLQRIGICYLIAVWLAWHLRPSMQWLLIFLSVGVYAALLHSGGSYAPFQNLPDRLDNALLGVHALIANAQGTVHRDPDGILSTMGALTTTVIGVRAGDWLRNGTLYKRWPIAVLLLASAYAWCLLGVPINKKMWTGPFVLLTSGWALLVLTLCHVLIDRLKWPPVGRIFSTHAKATYIGSLLILCVLYRFGWQAMIYRHLFASWLTPVSGENFSSLAYALTFTCGAWLCLKAFVRSTHQRKPARRSSPPIVSTQMLMRNR